MNGLTLDALGILLQDRNYEAAHALAEVLTVNHPNELVRTFMGEFTATSDNHPHVLNNLYRLAKEVLTKESAHAQRI